MLGFELNNTDATFEKNGEDSQIITIKPHTNILKEDLINLLKNIYDTENQEDYKHTIFLRLKGLPADLLVESIRYSLSREDLKNPLMILNILDLVKVYNTAHDSFFENEDVYVSSIEDLIDLRMALKTELKEFSKKLSIYFLSLFKSYSKTSFTPTDNPVEIPNVFSAIILSSDLFTLSGIFSSSNTFNTDECMYVKDAIKYVSNLLMKNAISMSFFNQFVGEENGDRTE